MAKILIVDDNEELETLYQWMLRPHGHEVRFARNAAIALRMVDEAPAACFVDVSLPDMDCADLVREIRKKLGHRVPLVILTGYERETAERFLAGASVDAICEKPYDLAELESILLGHLPADS